MFKKKKGGRHLKTTHGDKGCVVLCVCANPIGSSVMERNKTSFVLGVDVRSVLQQILCNLQVVVTS